MVKSLFKNTRIMGISSVVPQKELSILNDNELYNGDKKKIERVINSSGFLNRRVVSKQTTTADLCLSAAKDLIQKLNINVNTIDALLFLSYTPDYFMPATSFVLHKKLGLSQNCIVMDIPQACSGYVIGLYQSAMLLNSGCKRVLLLVGDTFSKFSDMFRNHTAPIFGDAGSATLIEYDKNAKPMYFSINSDGGGYDSLICQNGAFRNIPKKEDFYEGGSYQYNSIMDGGRIFDFTMNNIAPSIKDLLKFAGNSKDDFDYYIFHQANKFILQNLARQLEFDMNKMPVETLTKFGNQCGASIPCTISDMIQTEVQTKNLKCLLAGFGVGLSWASTIVNIDKIYCSKINEYEENQ